MGTEKRKTRNTMIIFLFFCLFVVSLLPFFSLIEVACLISAKKKSRRSYGLGPDLGQECLSLNAEEQVSFSSFELRMHQQVGRSLSKNHQTTA